jgi:hypothetical protein
VVPQAEARLPARAPEFAEHLQHWLEDLYARAPDHQDQGLLEPQESVRLLKARIWWSVIARRNGGTGWSENQRNIKGTTSRSTPVLQEDHAQGFRPQVIPLASLISKKKL